MVLAVRPCGQDDLSWAEELIGADFSGRMQARLGSMIDALACPGFVAERDGSRVGIVTFEGDTEVEIVYIEATERAVGVGSALLAAVGNSLRPDRLWLVTTNDNVDALRFYQRRGFVLREVRVGAVDEARRTLKPTIPIVGHHGIPIRDELVLERVPGS